MIEKSIMPMFQQTKGLLNMPGQNNCFLNSAVQVLWHLDIFRSSFKELTGHFCMGIESCIFCALKELFNQFQYSQESALPPDSLRRALAETFSDQRRFQLGFMDDAAECFENILHRIHHHIAYQESDDRCMTPHCVSHQKFAMNLVEQICCHACGATSDPLPFTQMVHYVSTPALVHQSKLILSETKKSSVSFGELLKTAGSIGDLRECPRSCGAKINIKKTLLNRPDIVSIGLVWDSERPKINHINDVFRTIGINLKMQDVFDAEPQRDGTQNFQSGPLLQLVGLVTYYGKHYSTFLFHTKLGIWIYFDDATVKEIGPHWHQVVERCIREHFQPLLLLYSNPTGTPIDTLTAPRGVTYIKTNRNLANKAKIELNNKCLPSSPQQLTPPISSVESKMFPLNPPPNHSSSIPRYQSNFQQQLRFSMAQGTMLNFSKQPLNIHSYTASQKKNRPSSVDDLLNVYRSTSGSEDVPDSPLTKSSTASSAYFSDVGEVESSYISKKAMENILNLQKSQCLRGNRNSTSSLESFDQKLTLAGLPKSCSLQRRDSGNSSAGGDRNSSSSGSSISSSENPYAAFHSTKRFNVCGTQNTNKIVLDQGYDTFSLSSSDSYPAIQGPPSSPVKVQHPRLSQIPEDVQLMELINASNMQDCDKLCSESDLLLLKSHEKEREGDLRAAAALSDSAAQKARFAMDAPYSNQKTLITAKMKHSMCVMRSASLHKRIKEAEAEEKRRLKAEAAASVVEIHHSRQSSRDSNHGRHSRQNSKDGSVKDVKCSKDTKVKKEDTSNQVAVAKNIEIYATLPRKGVKKKLLEQSLSSANSLVQRLKEEKRISAPINGETMKPQTEPIKRTDLMDLKCDAMSICSSTVSPKRSPKTSSKEADDYYSEWEIIQRNQVANKSLLQRTLSGSASCKENDSEVYGDLGDYQPNKKQHRVRRKILMGGFMKRKNRSLPDLREGSGHETTECLGSMKSLEDDKSKIVANVSSRGFHQPHRAFITDKGLYQRPSLLKVLPPLIGNQSKLLHPPKSMLPLPSPPTMNLETTVPSRSESKKDEIISLPSIDTIPRKPLSPSLGIDPSEELPPPPDDILKDLKEARRSIESQCNTQNRQATKLIVEKMENKSEMINTNSSNHSSINGNHNTHLNNKSAIDVAGKDVVDGYLRPGDDVVDGTLNSVKNLASRFEKITASTENEAKKPIHCENVPIKHSISPLSLHPPQNMEHSKSLPWSSTSSPQMSSVPSPSPSSNGSLRRPTGLRIVALLGTSLSVAPDTGGQKQKIPIVQPIPTNLMNLSSIHSPNNQANRPGRPPDYKTAMQRLGIMKAEMTTKLHMALPTSPNNQQINNSINIGNQSPLQNYRRVDQEAPNYFKEPIFNFQQDPPLSPSKKKFGPKKSVSFSDQVILVAHAEDDVEEHFPNPLLEKILGKTNIMSKGNLNSHEGII